MKLNQNICRNQHVTMTDDNYQQVFNYFRHCYFLTQTLEFEERRPYLERMNELLQETWYDFIWRTDLSSEVLVRMQAAKENLMEQSLEDIFFSYKQTSGTTIDQTISLPVVIFLAALLVIVLVIIAIIVKSAIARTLKRPSSFEQCMSEIDLRMMNMEPPRITASSSDGHFNCTIPSQVHIQMCDSHKDCNKNPAIIMEKCKTHNRTSEKKSCQTPRHRTDKCLFTWIGKRNNFFSKIAAFIFNFIQFKFCNEFKESPARTYSLCMTSSGISMSDELIPVFKTVRQMRLGNEKGKTNENEDTSQIDNCESTSTVNKN
ncbi:uncharacterized protein [Halyomorpha halys]|uniref:uncharacterized protein isoform X2 n=1 Tax=Halyomorpha halys TaxID=286706 RepID=UPI000D0C9426|nr:uncharacterized protein LOC106685421 isoform X2 [Halyomorpha halys]